MDDMYREEILARIQQEQEQASDVLAVVEATAAGKSGDQNTMMTSGSSTEVLTNRIADQLPDAPPPARPAPNAHNPFGSPRKSR